MIKRIVPSWLFNDGCSSYGSSIQTRRLIFSLTVLTLSAFVFIMGRSLPAQSQSTISINITKTVDWNGAIGAPVSPASAFNICLTGPTVLCKMVSAGTTAPFSNLANGTYTITEPNLGPEWTMQPINPFNGTTTLPQSLNQTVKNQYNPGNLQVTKTINWGGASASTQTFRICIKGPSYPTGNGDCKDFTGTTSTSQTWEKLLVGDYVVTEQLPAAKWSVSGSGVTVKVLPNSTAQTTITNSLRGTLGITKRVLPDGLPTAVSSTLFNICIKGPAQAPEAPRCAPLSDDGFKLWENLPPGQYTVSESPGSAWNVSFEPSNTVTVDGSAANVVVKNTLKAASLKLSQSVDKNLVVSGEMVVYTFLIENSGQVALTDITVADSECTPVPVQSGGFNIGDTNKNNQLDVTGDTPWQFSCVQQIIADTTNTASATGKSPVNLTVTSNNATASVDVRPSVRPSVRLFKTVEPASRAEPGGTFDYTLEIENTSAEPITITSLTDTYALNDECRALINQTVPINGKANCSYELTFTVPGVYENNATVEAQGTNDIRSTGIDWAKTEVLNLPSRIEVLKTASRNSVPESGAIVEFTIQVTNKSIADVVTINQLGDSIYGDVTFESAIIETTNCAVPFDLQPAGQPNAIYSCQFTVFISGDIGDQHTNYLTAVGVDDDQVAVRDSDSSTVAIVNDNSKLTVTKTPAVTQIAEPGGPVRFDVTVENLSAADSVTLQMLDDSAFGDVTVTNATSADAKITETTCILPVLMAVGETYSCYFVALVLGTAGDLHENSLVAIGEDDDGAKASAIGSAEIRITDIPATVSVTKSADKSAVPESGEAVRFTVTAVNTSLVDTITVSALTDDLFGNVGDDCAPALPATLAPGIEVTCIFTGFVAGDMGQPHVNTVTVEGYDDDGGIVTGTASTQITFTDVPSLIEVTKSANRTSASRAGDPIHFTVRVANLSTADVVTIESITDSAYGDVTDASNLLLLSTNCAVPQVMAAGQFYECVFQAMVNGELGEEHRNTLTVQGEDDDQQPVSGSDEVSILIADPVIEAIKHAELVNDADGNASPGDQIRYTIDVKNLGNAVAEAVAVNDIPDAHTDLVDGSVQVTVGTIEEGNLPDDERVLIQVGDLAPGEGATVIFDVIVSETLPESVERVTNQGLITGENFPVMSTQNPSGTGPTVTLVRPVPVLEATKTVALSVDSNADGNFTPGDQILYEIVLRNSGTAPASKITVSDIIDANTTLVNNSVSTTAGTVVIGNEAGEGAVIVEIETLAPGSQATIRFVARIKSPLPSAIGQIINQASITSEQLSLLTDDPKVDGSQDPTITNLRGVSTIEASKVDLLLIDQGESGYSSGDTLIYQVTIRNSGNIPASGINFVDTLDVNTTLLVGSVQSDQGAITRGNRSGDTSVGVNVGQIPGDGKVTISFQARVNENIAPELISISNQGSVNGLGITSLLTDDPAVEGKTNPTETVLRPTAVLRLTMTDIFFIDADSDGVVSVGDTLLYQLNLVNSGKNTASQILVENTLDPNIALVPKSVTSDEGAVQSGNGATDKNVIIAIDSLFEGENVSMSFLARVERQPANGLISNQASVRFMDSNSQVAAQQTIQSDDPTTSTSQDATATIVGQGQFGLIFIPVIQ